VDEKTIQLISDLKSKLRERDGKHAAIIRKATTEIMALKRQISAQNGKSDNGQLSSVVARLQTKIQNLQDDINDLTKLVSSVSKKVEPKETTDTTPHIEVAKEGDTTYVGTAEPDSSFDQPVWCIQKVSKSGSKTSVEVAEKAVWSKRKQESYA
jgi:predicted  nucleic acid-binding Zn-ribbon protein